MLHFLSKSLEERLKGYTLSHLPKERVERLYAAAPDPGEFGVDPFGFRLDFTLAGIGVFVWMYKHYFRCDSQGTEHIPDEPCLVIANHSGQLPFDGAMIAASILLNARTPRIVRSMGERWISMLPLISPAMTRGGVVTGTPENCLRLLSRGESVMVFPEGARGISKLIWQRYQLQEFGLGFARLALRAKVPIVPVAVVGAEEQAPALVNLKPLAALLGFPALPLVPQILPLPLPVKYRLYFDEPVRLDGNPDDEDEVIAKHVGRIKGAIQKMIHRGLSERRGIFA